MRAPASRSVWFYFVIFGISMAFAESAVVVYLRELYYPEGFSFPMVSMPTRIGVIEIIRELATILMLLAAGHLAGKNFRQRFAWFIFGFAVWDIFYYVFLKLLLNWPDSWFTWDILFLIPFVWTGPVIAPILVSATMILLSVTVMHLDSGKFSTKIKRTFWLFVTAGSILIFLSFVWDYVSFLKNQNSLRSLIYPDAAAGLLGLYVPEKFNWLLFLAGEASEIMAIWLLIFSSAKRKAYLMIN